MPFAVQQIPADWQGPGLRYVHQDLNRTSLKEIIAPKLSVMSHLPGWHFLGKNSTAGLLTGALVSGVQLAISTSNTAGAWDNAKKYIEATRRQSGAKSF